MALIQSHTNRTGHTPAILIAFLAAVGVCNPFPDGNITGTHRCKDMKLLVPKGRIAVLSGGCKEQFGYSVHQDYTPDFPMSDQHVRVFVQQGTVWRRTNNMVARWRQIKSVEYITDKQGNETIKNKESLGMNIKKCQKKAFDIYLLKEDVTLTPEEFKLAKQFHLGDKMDIYYQWKRCIYLRKTKVKVQKKIKTQCEWFKRTDLGWYEYTEKRWYHDDESWENRDDNKNTYWKKLSVEDTPAWDNLNSVADVNVKDHSWETAKRLHDSETTSGIETAMDNASSN